MSIAGQVESSLTQETAAQSERFIVFRFVEDASLGILKTLRKRSIPYRLPAFAGMTDMGIVAVGAQQMTREIVGLMPMREGGNDKRSTMRLFVYPKVLYVILPMS